MSIRSRDEDEIEKVARYLGGLRLKIQDELVVAKPKNVDECFQFPIRVEEKIKIRQEKFVRGRGTSTRGRGSISTSK